MSIWNLIRDWFVEYIWGGTMSNSTVKSGFSFGSWMTDTSTTIRPSSTQIFVNLGFLQPNGNEYKGIMIGDWLSTTSTIIVLVLLLIAFGYLIVNLFKMFSNIFSLKR